MKNCAQTRALAVIAITLAAALSACGSTGSSGSSTSSTSTKSPSAAATNAASGDPNLVFAQCMREKGFDVPDTGLTPGNTTFSIICPMIPSAKIIAGLLYLKARSKPRPTKSAISCTEDGAKVIKR